jgi:hypothetical protein
MLGRKRLRNLIIAVLVALIIFCYGKTPRQLAFGLTALLLGLGYLYLQSSTDKGFLIGLSLSLALNIVLCLFQFRIRTPIDRLRLRKG